MEYSWTFVQGMQPLQWTRQGAGPRPLKYKVLGAVPGEACAWAGVVSSTIIFDLYSLSSLGGLLASSSLKAGSGPQLARRPNFCRTSLMRRIISNDHSYNLIYSISIHHIPPKTIPPMSGGDSSL